MSCSHVYFPIACYVLNHIHDIGYAFVSYRDIDEFKIICLVMKEKFKKYWKYIPKLFVYVKVMDPQIDFSSAIILVNEIAKNLNVRLDIDNLYFGKSLNNIYL